MGSLRLFENRTVILVPASWLPQQGCAVKPGGGRSGGKQVSRGGLGRWRPWGKPHVMGRWRARSMRRLRLKSWLMMQAQAAAVGGIGAAPGAVQGPAKLRRPSPSQGRLPALSFPVPLIPCSSLQTLCLLAPTGQESILNLFSVPKTLLPPFPIHPTLVFSR